eukprot:5874774-Karenia_brevis.AAC.1
MGGVRVSISDPIQLHDPWLGRAGKAHRTMAGKGLGPDVGPVATVPPSPYIEGQPGSSSTHPNAAHPATAHGLGQPDKALQAMLDAHAAKLQQQTAKALSNFNCDVTESTQALVSQ